MAMHTQMYTQSLLDGRGRLLLMALHGTNHCARNTLAYLIVSDGVAEGTSCSQHHLIAPDNRKHALQVK